MIMELIGWFHKISVSTGLADNLKKLCHIDAIHVQSDQPTSDIIAQLAPHFAEVIRSIQLFHNHPKMMA